MDRLWYDAMFWMINVGRDVRYAKLFDCGMKYKKLNGSSNVVVYLDLMRSILPN